MLDCARQLGIEVRSLEQNWKDLQPRWLLADRDDEAAAAMLACLAERPGRRLFVIRGEGHTLPGGYLCRRLGFEPMVVLTAAFPPARALGDHLPSMGRIWRVGSDSTYVWATWEIWLTPAAITEWVDRR